MTRQASHVDLRLDEDVVDVEVVDQGVFSPVRAALHRGLGAESGRGIPIILALVEELEFAQTGRGTRVRMSKRATSREGPSSFGYGNSMFG